MGTLETDEYNEPAPWWTSRSVIGALVSALSGAALLTGHAIDATLLGPITDIALALATVIGSIVAAEGRISAERKLKGPL